jgi:predicted nuclease of predicted toxin-antitoxin system
MRFLGDVGVSTSTLKALREAGYDAVHVREQNLHRLPDSAILRNAFEEGRILITFDLDFGDLLAFSRSSFPSVIIFRLHNQTPLNVTRRLFDLLSMEGPRIKAGALVIVEDSRYRVRRLPILAAPDS